MISLPVDGLLPNVVSALRTHSGVVLRAPTGSGKTTRVPPGLLDSGLAGEGLIVMLEPRRLAARAAARRMAHERDCRVGDVVGYQVRFDRQAGPNTRILVVTPGILLRMMQADPFLESVRILLFDEFHERQLESDLALGIARLLQQTVRADLKLVVMSATLETDSVTAYLGNVPLIVSEGRTYPVDIQYESRSNQTPLPMSVAKGVKTVLAQTPGDVLVFLPGMYEIRQAARELEDFAAQKDLLVIPLHGDLPTEEQDAALLPQGRRKVVLSTNVAETSVTVEGVTAVVDSGLARIMEFDPHVGMDRLEVQPISRASADQRAGRAGRTQPGICLRLWSEIDQRSRPEQTAPEIRRVDLAGPLLQLLELGEDLEKFPWLEPPRPASVQQGLDLLRRLGAIEEGKITDLGRQMTRLPVSPRLARMLVEAQRWGEVHRVALAAAFLSERDPFMRNSKPMTLSKHRTSSDILDRIDALEEFQRSGAFESSLGTLNRNGARFVLRARDQIVHSLGMRGQAHPSIDSDAIVLRSLFAGFPDRLIRRRTPGGRKGVMVGGRGIRLDNASGVTETELFLGIDVDAGEMEALVRLASSVERDWLPPELVQSVHDVIFDERTGRVLARKRLLFEDLLLEETGGNLPDEETVAGVLADAALRNWDKVFPADDCPAGQFLLRLRCLGEWLPELKLPAFTEEELRDVLKWLCMGKRSLDDLKKADWLGVLEGKLTYEQRQILEREAPERYEVPSGSRIALQYEKGRPPILAVRIQEMFGLKETPTVASGRVKILLHLLAPNFRPQQVTEDLASFWANTYPQVRKELRARYPKHSWPEDPLTAVPQQKPGKRG